MPSISYALLLAIAIEVAVASPAVRPFIVGGEDAAPGEFPYAVTVQFKADSFHVCGGAILDDDHVLTTAACCSSFPFLDEMRVVAGEHQLSVESGNEQVSF